MKFILALMYIFTSVFVLKTIKKAFKNMKSTYEKTLLVCFLVLYFIPIMIYLLDYLNIPTKVGYFKGMNIDRWFNFLSSYINSIVATLLSGIILVIITFKQMSIQKDDNKETKRIENAPLFKYDFSNIDRPGSISYLMLNSNGKDLRNYSLYMEIENIGLNHARNVSVEVNVGKEYKNTHWLDDSQSILEKGKSIELDLVFWFRYNNDDKNNNKYIQKIQLKCHLTNTFGSLHRGYKLSIESKKVFDENLL